MPSADIDIIPHGVSDDVRGKLDTIRRTPKSMLMSMNLVLGYDPLIPPQLLQAEVPAVGVRYSISDRTLPDAIPLHSQMLHFKLCSRAD